MRNRELLAIFLTVFIDLVGFGIVIPILPYYAQHYGASGWEIGWLMTSYSLMQFIFAPVWGRISDFVGRKPVLLVSIFGAGASMVVLGLAGSLEWIFIGRIAAGICGGNISTAYAYITDVTSEKDRARGMGLIGAAFGLGFIFGPAIGGFLSERGYEWPMFAGAALAFINFFMAVFILREPVLTAEDRAAHRTKRFSGEALRYVFGRPQTAVSILLFFLMTFAVVQMEVVFAIYMKAVYGFDAFDAGMVLALIGIIMVIIQGTLIGGLARRYGELKLVITGTALAAAGLFFYAITLNVVAAILFLCLMGVGHGLMHPSLSSLASQGADADKRGLTMGVFHSASSLARVLAPPVAGFFYDQMSWRSPFLAASGVLIVATAVAGLWRFLGKPREGALAETRGRSRRQPARA